MKTEEKVWEEQRAMLLGNQPRTPQKWVVASVWLEGP